MIENALRIAQYAAGHELNDWAAYDAALETLENLPFSKRLRQEIAAQAASTGGQTPAAAACAHCGMLHHVSEAEAHCQDCGQVVG